MDRQNRLPAIQDGCHPASVRGVLDVRTRVMRRFWDAHSRGWDDIRTAPHVQAHVLGIIDYLAAVVRPGGSVLDVGCGPGHHAVALASKGFEVTGVDLSPAMLKRAETKADEQSLTVTFHQADLSSDLPFAAETFDAAFCVGVLQVIPNASTALRRISRLLRPGGHLLVEMSLPGPFVPVSAMPLRLTDAVLTRVKHVAARVPGVLGRYAPDEMEQLFRSAGLVTVETQTYERTYTVLGRR